MDDFGHSSTWNKEINKWLGLIYKIDNNFYENGKNRIKQSNEKRDQFLGEVFSIFYFHEIFNAKNFKIEPSGCGNKKLDFSSIS